MPPVFGPLSSSKTALWSCVGCKRHDGPARHQGQHAQLLALEPLFDDDLPAGGAAELLAHHDAFDGGQGLFGGRADDDALAGGQAVGLDDDGILARLDVVAGRVGVVEDAELGGRHVGVAHELLGEHLARLQLGRLLRRPEDAQPRLVEDVDDALRQRVFRADDGQADLLLLGEADQGVEVVDVDGDVDAVLGGAGVARGAVDAA